MKHIFARLMHAIAQWRKDRGLRRAIRHLRKGLMGVWTPDENGKLVQRFP